MSQLVSIKEAATKTLTTVAQKHGFIKASILLDWSDIVGDFSKYCSPVRVYFPYKKRREGILYVRACSGPMATQVSYLEPVILEKINRYFGYEAIARLVLHQGPVEVKETPTKKWEPVLPVVQEAIEQSVSCIPPSPLQTALLNLGLALAQRQDNLSS